VSERSRPDRKGPDLTPGREVETGPALGRILDMKGLVVERLAAGGEAVYRFSGTSRSSDSAFLDALGNLRRRILDETAPVVLDVSALEMINSPFVGLLSGLLAAMDERGARLALIGPRRQVSDLLSVVGILGAFEARATPKDDRPAEGDAQAR
jgi:anti-anti-sigma regulatory factor